jgi:hypothetical protein
MACSWAVDSSSDPARASMAGRVDAVGESARAELIRWQPTWNSALPIAAINGRSVRGPGGEPMEWVVMAFASALNS